MIRKIALGSFVVMWLVAPAVYATTQAVDKKDDKKAVETVKLERINEQGQKARNAQLEILGTIDQINKQIGTLQAQAAQLQRRYAEMDGASQMAALLATPELPAETEGEKEPEKK